VKLSPGPAAAGRQSRWGGGPADPPNSLTIQDHFHNYNHFYGGQIGGWVRWYANNLDFGITGKLALGVTQQLAIIDGSTNLNTPGASPTPNASGVLVQPTNTGRFFNSTFGIVPEVAFDLGYRVTPGPPISGFPVPVLEPRESAWQRRR
jgi:hypothetical protein